MSQNKFKSILANLHVADNTANLAFAHPGQKYFGHKTVLRTFSKLHIDLKLTFSEASFPFKGRLHLNVYNPP